MNVKQYGEQVADILFAELSKAPSLQLVERTELEKAGRSWSWGSPVRLILARRRRSAGSREPSC